MKKISKEGIYQLTDDIYHADPCVKPSFSSSIGWKILSQSPRHAWFSHSRLNPDFKPEEKRSFDIGSAAHDLFLRGLDSVTIVEADDWRTKEAKSQRAEIRAAGQIPLLKKEAAELIPMRDALVEQLSQHRGLANFAIPAGPQFGGKTEETYIFKLNGVWCRSKLDWTLDIDGNHFVIDYKTTGGSAHPDAWTKARLFEGPAMQSAVYQTAYKRLKKLKVDPVFLWIVQETKPPYAVSVMALTPIAEELAHQQFATALDMWSACLKANRWPGYPTDLAWVEPPPYTVAAWDNRLESERQMRREKRVPVEQLVDWQAPITTKKGRTK